MPLKYLSLSLCICLPLFVGCDDESSTEMDAPAAGQGGDGGAAGEGGIQVKVASQGTPHKAGALGSKTQGVQPVLVVLPDQAVWVVKRAMPVKPILVWAERRHRQASSAVSSSNQSN